MTYVKGLAYTTVYHVGGTHPLLEGISEDNTAQCTAFSLLSDVVEAASGRKDV